MKSTVPETETKLEEEVAQLGDTLRKTYSFYQDFLHRISIDVGSTNNLLSYLYVQPTATFASPPEAQNEALNRLIAHIGKLPPAEPLTLHPDELAKRIREAIRDRSSPASTKDTLLHEFRRRVDSLNIQRFRLIQRLSYAMVEKGSEMMDHYMLVVSSSLENLKFQTQMAVERCLRLQNSDCLESSRERPKLPERLQKIYEEHKVQSEHSLIRVDDVEVYLRIKLLGWQKRREIGRLVNAVAWLPYSHGRELWVHSRDLINQQAIIVNKQREEHAKRVEAQLTADFMGLGIAPKEAEVRSAKYVAGMRGSASTGHESYSGKNERPPGFIRNTSELKVMMLNLGQNIGLDCSIDINLDRGHSYCRELYYHFGRLFSKQTLEVSVVGYEGESEEQLQNFQRLAKLAEKERGISEPKQRLMATQVFASRLYAGETWTNQRLWTPRLDEQEEEIWCTIHSVVGGRIDPLLETEAKGVDQQDLSLIEDLLELATEEYYSRYLTEDDPVNDSFSSIDLSAIDALQSDQEDEAEASAKHKAEDKHREWKHVLKAYLVERLLLMRECKRKIGYALNYFCAVERRMTHDMIEIASEHTSNSADAALMKFQQLGPRKQNAKDATQKLLQPSPELFHDASGQPLHSKSGLHEASLEEEGKSEAHSILRMIRLEEDEVRVVDHQGVHVFLEPALAAMKSLMQRILVAGTYYTSQYEGRQGLFKKGKKAIVDRGSVLHDLLGCECRYQYAKLGQVEQLMKIYEHTTDVAEIQQLGQCIVNCIHARPRLHLTSHYFQAAYRMEEKCCARYTELLSGLITLQMKREGEIDQSTSQTVQLKSEAYAKLRSKGNRLDKREKSGGKPTEVRKSQKGEHEVEDPYKGAESESYKKKLEDILELHPMKERDLYEAHYKLLKEEREEDGFEAYFQFTSLKEGWSNLEEASAPTVPPLTSFPCVSLTSFCSSLSEIVRVISAIKHSSRICTQFFASESGLAVAAFEAAIAQMALSQYHALGTPNEITPTLASVDTVPMAASPEILIFTLKELLVELNKDNLYEVNPYYVARLPVSRLRDVDFYCFSEQSSGAKQHKGNASWPLMIKFLCNLVEWTNLRESLVQSLQQSQLLSQIYKRQQDLASQHIQTIQPDPIPFARPKMMCRDYSCFQACNQCKLGFAIQEIDPSFLSLLCFHKPEAIKHSLFDSGLEEVRSVLHYEMMQSQLLTMAVRMNNWTYLPFIRAFAEIDGVTGNYRADSESTKKKSTPFVTPTGVLGLRLGEDNTVYSKEKGRIRERMMTAIGSCFVNVASIKQHLRGLLETSFQTYVSKTQKDGQHNGNQVSRLFKTYKNYLVHVYCDHTLQATYSLYLHSHLFAVSNALREIARYFPENESFLDCHKSYGLEQAPFSAGFSYAVDEAHSREGLMESCDMTKTLLAVPSTEEIALMIRLASKDMFIAAPKLTYELDDEAPEDLARAAVNEGTCEAVLEKRQKKWMRNDREAKLPKYDSLAFELLNGLAIIHGVIKLELAIEGINIPLNLWLQLFKNLKMNLSPWSTKGEKRASILDLSPHASKTSTKLEKAIHDEIREEVRLSPLLYLLRNVAHKLRVMDFTLYKTCGYKHSAVMDYFLLYFKYKYSCLVEALYKCADDMPLNSGNAPECFSQLVSTINRMTQQNLMAPTYVSSGSHGPAFFRFSDLPRFDQHLSCSTPPCQAVSQTDQMQGRCVDPQIVKIVYSDLWHRWRACRIPHEGTTETLPISNIHIHMSRALVQEDVRKMMVAHIALIEGKAQVEYAGGSSEADESDFFILPVEVVKTEDLREQFKAVQERLRLRRFKFAAMAWYTNTPAMHSVEHTLEQRKVLLDRTFVPLMNIKDEIQFEAEKRDLPRNLRLRKEVRSETNLLKHLIARDFLLKGIECIKSEQALIAELLDKGTSYLESSLESTRGTAATLFSNVDPEQRKCLVNSMMHVQSFVTQIKNRANLIESLTTGTAMIITLHDFNSSLYTLCRNLWHQLTAQYRTCIWAEKKLQQRLHHQAHTEMQKRAGLTREVEHYKENFEYRIAVEVGQRCYEQIYEIEKSRRQCRFWVAKLKAIERGVRKELRLELQQELQEKELELKNYETQFVDYKDTLVAQLKSEIAGNNLSLSRKFAPKLERAHAHNPAQVTSVEDAEKVAESYEQLAKLQERIHKLRLFYTLRTAVVKSKYKRKLCLTREQMTKNGVLWNELSLAERREMILKQELTNTQQNLAACERALKQLQANLKDKNNALMRYQQTKHSNAQRLEELESKLKRYSFTEAIDVNQLQVELLKKERELTELRGAVSSNEEKVDSIKTSYKTQMKWMQRKLQCESAQKTTAMQKIDELQVMLQQSEMKPVAGMEEGADIWKEKCKELVDICKALKNENEMLRQIASDQSRIQAQSQLRSEEDRECRSGTPCKHVAQMSASRCLPPRLPLGVTGTHKEYSQKPGTRQTRASSHGGMNKSYSGRDPHPEVALRPQTQHHPFFISQRKRLKSGVPQSRHTHNTTAYPF